MQTQTTEQLRQELEALLIAAGGRPPVEINCKKCLAKLEEEPTK